MNYEKELDSVTIFWPLDCVFCQIHWLSAELPPLGFMPTAVRPFAHEAVMGIVKCSAHNKDSCITSAVCKSPWLPVLGPVYRQPLSCPSSPFTPNWLSLSLGSAFTMSVLQLTSVSCCVCERILRHRLKIRFLLYPLHSSYSSVSKRSTVVPQAKLFRWHMSPRRPALEILSASGLVLLFFFLII